MKVYQVHYRNDEDNNMLEYYTSKAKAEKRQRKLKKIEATSDYEDDNNGVNMLYDLHSFDVQVSKKGIMNMLNGHFYTDF